MRTALLVLALVLPAACTERELTTAELPKSGPFIGVDLTKLPAEDRRVLQEASEDFQAVVAGRKPVHAVFDEAAPLPADGGTTYYKGSRYRLTSYRSVCSLGEFHGMIYGPIIDFDAEFAGGQVSVADLRVYSGEELDKLLSSRARK